MKIYTKKGDKGETSVGPAPFNDKAKVKWDKGVNTGVVSLEATLCYTELDNNGNPDYDELLSIDETYTVHIFDADMVDLIVVGESQVNCASSVITLKLNVVNTHLSPNQLQGIQWNVPSGWAILPNSGSGGTFYGANFPNVKIDPNGNGTGQNTVSVSYNSPNICPTTASYERSVTFNMGCKPVINYTTSPGFYQSHSGERTSFSFSQPTTLPVGHNYTYASGERIDLNTNFSVVADEETTFDALIAPCSCASPWHDPNQQAPTTITYDGNFNKSVSAGRNEVVEENQEPLQEGALAGQETLHIYPNPSTGKVWIEAEGIVGQQNIIVFSSDGRIVFDGKHDFDSNTRFSIDLRNQPKGLYYIKVSDRYNKTCHNQKLILK